MWTLKPKGTFSIKSAWQGFRKPHFEVLWWKSVWFKRHVPRWAIIQWIAAWGRLSTKDILLSLGIVTDAKCVLCDIDRESHNHIFSSVFVWKQLLARNNICQDPGCLAQDLEWTTQNKEGEGLHNILYKLSLAATLYHLWRERSFRVFQDKKEDPVRVVQKIISDLRVCMSAWRNFKRTPLNQRICQDWNVSCNIQV
ncbi:hypothetical protein RHGRI_004313 [Rhododendron griersonianum]|uniref:Reverse transcriptase zinc-binding domain-containing protein n=1 Tax=Rhododendron griersonianum TaxID=479676 RepID=A0AAV6L8Y9_9ERIC|nr:hypothetical protein RHGRI_004313 [Rhododendron griersonianum]